MRRTRPTRRGRSRLRPRAAAVAPAEMSEAPPVTFRFIGGILRHIVVRSTRLDHSRPDSLDLRPEGSSGRPRRRTAATDPARRGSGATWWRALPIAGFAFVRVRHRVERAAAARAPPVGVAARPCSSRCRSAVQSASSSLPSWSAINVRSVKACPTWQRQRPLRVGWLWHSAPPHSGHANGSNAPAAASCGGRCRRIPRRRARGRATEPGTCSSARRASSAPMCAAGSE
jgi:hypothetical protein